ncbi:MAG: GFA family protein [Paracoccaceae bacterium]
MPSEAASGRCYCGAVCFSASKPPHTVAHCHCVDCRRWTGGAVGTFAAFSSGDLTFSPLLGPGSSVALGVKRWFCQKCGSPLAATFDYLPGQTYVPVGVLNNADEFPAELHCHSQARLSWFHLNDDLPSIGQSARAELNSNVGSS